jgi:uncharacterized phage protein (TIGR02218 family)
MTYLFEFYLANGEEIFLTSSSNIILLNGKKYLPNSGLTLTYIEKHQLHIEASIKGFFENDGIEKSTLLENSNLKVFCLNREMVKSDFLFLDFFEIISDLISFEIGFFSKSMLLKRTLLSRISKTCRASLGDSRCNVRIQKFLEVVKLLSVDKNKIVIYKSNKPDGYFNDGKLILSNGMSYDVVSSTQEEIIIDGEAEGIIDSEIILYPSCDKKFSTCKRKFDNAINFRGEPFIGEDYEGR